MEHSRIYFRALALSGVAAAALLSGATARAQAEEAELPYEFDIQSGDLAVALTEFARQSGKPLLYSPALVEGRRAPAINGEMVPAEALARLLPAAEFDVSLTSSGAYLIRLSDAADGAATGSAGDAAQPVDEEPEADQRGDATDGRAPGSRFAAASDVIVVTGTRIEGAEATNPSIFLNRADFEAAGYSSTAELLADLPQNLNEINAAPPAQGASRIASESPDRATGVSLLGLGPQSTLVLVNGRRFPGAINGRVVDVSSLPLAMIDRVEIITGGASALYGSDAVAGVANFVTRRRFEGVEAQAYYGFAEEGAERFQASLVTGKDGERGGFIAGYDYQRDWPLDTTEAGVSGPSPAGVTPVPGRFYLQPDSWRDSVFGSGEFELNDRVELYADALFASSKFKDISEYSFGPFLIDDFSTVTSDQLTVTAGARIDLAGDWTLDTAGTYGKREGETDIVSASSGPILQASDEAELAYASATFSGTLPSVGGLDPRLAIGGEIRTESYIDRRPASSSVRTDETRDIGSLFGELRLPFVENGEGALMRRFEVSLAARYDDYSDFGDTFDPQIGVIWAPASALTLRGSYGTAFRAPSLYLQGFGDSSTQVILRNLPDPQSLSGVSPVFTVSGVSDELTSEEAETFTLSADYRPPRLGDTVISLSFFDVSYEDRIDQPAVGSDAATVLLDEEPFRDLISRDPAEATLREFYQRTLALDSPFAFLNLTGVPFDPGSQDFRSTFPDLVLFDNRRSNIGVENVRGIDFQANSAFDTGIGRLSFGVNGLYYLEFERAVTASAPFVELVNSPGKPVDFRMRASAGWSRGAWAVTGFANYVDAYTDTLADPQTEIESWTTFDLTLRFDGAEAERAPALSGFSAVLAVDNVFDEAPPFFGSDTFGIAFDRANADARGRFISLQLRKRW